MADEYKKVQMETILKLHRTCTIPIITYSTEACPLTEQEISKLNTINSKALKRLINTPKSAPNVAVRTETALQTINEAIEEKQINYYRKQILHEHDHYLLKTTWENKMTNKTLPKYQLTKANLEDNGATKFKNLLQLKKNSVSFNSLTKESGTKTKHIVASRQPHNINKTPNYMKKLTRTQSSAIFNLRCNMLKIRDNFRKESRDISCRWCSHESETQEHILNHCQEFKPITQTMNIQDIINDNHNSLKREANQIIKLIKKLEEKPLIHTPNQTQNP